MNTKLVYPFQAHFMKKNLMFLTFCPVDFLDSDNRPVLENRSLIYKLETTSFKKCPYKDSRANTEKLMNQASLRSFIQHKDKVYEVIKRLCSTFGLILTDKEKNSIQGIYFTNYVLYKLASFSMLKNFNNDEIRIPVEYSIISRISHGVINFVHELSYEICSENKEFQITFDSLYSMANERGNLMDTKGACAAPGEIIKQYFSTINDSMKSPTLDKDSLLFIKYGYLNFQLELLALIYETIRAKLWRTYNKNYEIKTNPQPKPLFAINYCMVAHKISKFKNSFENSSFKRTYTLYTPIYSLDGIDLDHILKLAKQLENEIDKNNFSPNLKLIFNFRELAKLYFSDIANEMKIFDFKNEIIENNIDIFFGEWPTLSP